MCRKGLDCTVQHSRESGDFRASIAVGDVVMYGRRVVSKFCTMYSKVLSLCTVLESGCYDIDAWLFLCKFSSISLVYCISSIWIHTVPYIRRALAFVGVTRSCRTSCYIAVMGKRRLRYYAIACHYDLLIAANYLVSNPTVNRMT
jgi:hypothetical protein